jgi:hypothetical protein
MKVNLLVLLKTRGQINSYNTPFDMVTHGTDSLVSVSIVWSVCLVDI